ncbi:hypothetical protein PFISCL1PPCAC_3486, partial [Pristionchus fissidentatus]
MMPIRNRMESLFDEDELCSPEFVLCDFLIILSFRCSYSIPAAMQRSKRHRRHTNLSPFAIAHFPSPCRHTNVFLEIIERLKNAAHALKASRPKMDVVTFVEQTRHFEEEGTSKFSAIFS